MNTILFCIMVHNEEKTIELTINSIINAFGKKNVGEVLIVSSGCTDTTDEIITKFIHNGFPIIHIIEKERRGKIKALEIAFSFIEKAKHDYFFFTDGDVVIHKDAINQMIGKFKHNKNIDCLTGHPLPVNDNQSFFGFIANENCEIWNLARTRLDLSLKVWPLTGYLFCVRNGVSFEKTFGNFVAEDSYFGLVLLNKGYRLGYCGDAFVFVKFPTNFYDYWGQKARTRFGWNQINKKYPDEFKELQKIKSQIILFRISKGNLVCLISYILDKIAWLISKILIIDKKKAILWKKIPSTKDY